MPHLVTSPHQKRLNDKFVRVCAQSFFYLILTAAALKSGSRQPLNHLKFSISVFVCLNNSPRSTRAVVEFRHRRQHRQHFVFAEEEEEDSSFEKVSTARSSIKKDDSNTSGIHKQLTVYSV
jgi:hypothetical protein